LPEDEPNYLVQAFKSQYNLIGLGTAIGFAVLSGSLFPLLLAAGVELTVLPLLERYQRYQRARSLESEKRHRKQTEISDMLRALSPGERERYNQLQTLAGEIRENYKGLDSSSRMLLDELVGKLEFLLAFYLRMRYSVVRYEAYFATTQPDAIRQRIAVLEKEMPSGPERVQQIKAKTKAVLEKRLVRYEKALENKQLIEAQTETVQEVLQLLRDQSFSMRDPRSITEQLDGLVSSAEETERGVKDMEEILSAEQDILLPASPFADIEAELEEGRRAARSPQPAVASAPPRVRVPPPPTTVASPPPPRKKITH
jgi:hypothetical protein